MRKPQEAHSAAQTASAWALRLGRGPVLGAEQIKLQAWLAQDPGHADLLQKAMTLLTRIETDGSGELDMLRGETWSNFTRRSRWNGPREAAQRFSAIAACLVAALGLYVATPSIRANLFSTTYRTGASEWRTVELSDRSRLSLDAGTVVKVHYEDGRRQLWLQEGRANFEVAKDALRPFTVAAGNKTVIATGTEFSVDRKGKDGRVVLYEGRVSVMANEDGFSHWLGGWPRPKKTVAFLTAGQMYLGDPSANGRVDTLNANVIESTLAWKQGQLVFDQTPLTSAIDEANHYATAPITLVNPRRRPVDVSGIYRAGDTAAFVAGVTAAYPVDASMEDGRYVLTVR
jgi:transmembrane sensor